jgi:hypothetical protein
LILKIILHLIIYPYFLFLGHIFSYYIAGLPEKIGRLPAKKMPSTATEVQ